MKNEIEDRLDNEPTELWSLAIIANNSLIYPQALSSPLIHLPFSGLPKEL